MKTIFYEAAVLLADADINAPQKECDKGCSASYRDLGTSYDNEWRSRAGLSKGGQALLQGLQTGSGAARLNLSFYATTEAA